MILKLTRSEAQEGLQYWLNEQVLKSPVQVIEVAAVPRGGSSTTPEFLNITCQELESLKKGE